MAKSHPLKLPPSFSPDDLDPLTELSIVLCKIRAGLQASDGLVAPSGPSANGPHLTFKEIPGATDGLKHKLQHARTQVSTLPDMGRTIDEQRSEIMELERKVKLQRALLERLKEDGLKFGKEEDDGGDKMEVD